MPIGNNLDLLFLSGGMPRLRMAVVNRSVELGRRLFKLGRIIMKKVVNLLFLKSVMASVVLLGMASHAAAASVGVQILSATVKDKKIDGANITLQKNGEQSVSGTTNAQGQVTLNASFADDPSALMIVKKDGYSNLVVKCPCGGMTYAISPVMSKLDGMRIVLNWGVDPMDLDSHLLFPGNHIYFRAKTGSNALLDVDDTTSYGPETITINRKYDGQRYVYAVHDFSDREARGSDRLSKSGARVYVYVGQTLIKTYHVPVSDSAKGNLWTVFAVTEAGEIQDINSVGDAVTNSTTGTVDTSGIIGQAGQVASYNRNDQDSAKRLNKQGEDAYHAKHYDEAIRLYREAIDLDGNYGQAFSNLGLAFQKAGRVAEAMWANRKAIALASGPTAATVRASSHYNNGRIYEAAGQWEDALREYKYAKNEKANKVYDKAIDRMKQKGAGN